MSANSSRRSFLKSSALAGAACMLRSPALASSAGSSVIVVGAGAFGGWSALQLAHRGMRVTLVDAWGPGNSRASSGGETRTIRATYGPAHTLYVKMVARALQLWQEYQERWNLKLFFRSGALRMAGADDSYETAALPVLKEAGIRFERLSAAECARRWPQVNFDVFAPGPWLGSVFPFLRLGITPTRQEVFFFGTPAGETRYSEEQLPTWIDGGKHPFFGVPGNDWRGFKIADDTRVPVIDPSTMEREISQEKLSAARAYMRLRFPALSDAPLLESRVCQYENSTDHNFILDHHPEADNVWIVGGGSGHGFKHGPVMGEMLADAVLDSKEPPTEMGLGRLLRVTPS